MGLERRQSQAQTFSAPVTHVAERSLSRVPPSQQMVLPTNFAGVWGPVTATIDWCEVSYLFIPRVIGTNP